MANYPAQISLGRYLFERLRQLEVNTIFGVPGDFNLALLDYIYDVEGLRWAGNANELNAGYAADGYSRIKRLSAMVTTFGVGELSCLNAIAGAYSEHVGLLHIVGVPSTESQSQKLLLHHTLGNGDFTVFQRMSAEISVEAYDINSIKDAPAVIDKAIRDAYINQKPVYLALPTNFVDLPIDSARLSQTPIDLSLPANDADAEEEVYNEILRLISDAKDPIILVDACAGRHDVAAETKKLIDLTQFPTFVTPMGKSTVDENHPRFGGVYVGSLTSPDVKEVVEKTDLVISVGGLMSDFNTGSFTYGYKTNNIIEFHSDYTKVRRATWQGVQMQHLLKKIVENKQWVDRLNTAIKSYDAAAHPVPSVKLTNTAAEEPETIPLNQKWFWTELSSWLQEGDIIITETGTSAFGIASTKFPKNTIGISQVLWGSIGFTVGATLGAAFANDELAKPRRVLLFVGDGSLQLTVQEISTMIRWNLTPYLFILNNNGYTIEKLIHGPKAGYNEIQPWDHQNLLKTFGALPEASESIKAKSVGDVKKLFNDKAFAKADKIRVVELFFPVMDAPTSLVKQAELTAADRKSVV